jgi:hypothetical protein
MPRIGLGLGISSNSKLPPSPGINVANTAFIVVAGFNNEYIDGTYQRTNQAVGFLADSTNGGYNYASVQKQVTGGTLYAGYVYFTSPLNQNNNGDYYFNEWILASSSDGAAILARNPSTNINYLPTTGWTNDNGNPINITITAGVAPTPTPTASPTLTPSPTRTPTQTPTASPTLTPSPTRTPTATPTQTPTASPATSIARFGVPNNIIVASYIEGDPAINGTYTKKSPGNNLTTSAPVFVLSGTGCGYSCIHGGNTFVLSPSTYVMYNGTPVSTALSVWSYAGFSFDGYGNLIYELHNSQTDATDINNMPTFWAKNGGGTSPYRILSVCVSAEASTSYLPITSRQFYIDQIKLTNAFAGSYEARNDAFYFCQPLTASEIDSEGSGPTGKMVWRGSRTYNTTGNGQLRLFVTYGKYVNPYYGGFLNDGRPYWRAILFNSAYVSEQEYQTMLWNFNTSAFGIPLSGWNSIGVYTDPTQFNAGLGRDNYPVFRTSLPEVTFGTPQKIIVANNQDRDKYQNGGYTRKSTGNILVPAPATAWQLSGTGYGYSSDIASVTATDLFNGGHTFIVSPSSYIALTAMDFKTTPLGRWGYINVRFDVYGNPVATTKNSQLDATDNNNMPTYWAKNGDADWYNGILSVCVSAESMDTYLPISTQMLSISGITLRNDNFYNNALYFCQPLTAAAIDSDGSGATGKMVWQGSRIYPNISSSTLRLLLTFGIHKSFSSGIILNAGRPYWRLAFRDTRYGDSDSGYQTLMANYNTSAFGIPLSGWSLDPNQASQVPFYEGNGRSNYPILSAATTVASRNSVNITGSTYSEALNQGNGVYTKRSVVSNSLGAYLEGTVYGSSNNDMFLYYEMSSKSWLVEDNANGFIYYNNYQGTRVIPQSGWKNFYVNTPSTFTVR